MNPRLILAGVFASLLSTSAFGQVVFSEIVYNPVGTDDGLELIEIQNTSGVAIDLHQWAIFLDNVSTSGQFVYQFADGRTLAPGAYVTVHFLASGPTTDPDDLYTESEGEWLSANTGPIENTHFSLSLFQKDSGRFVGPDWQTPSLLKDFVQVGGHFSTREYVAVSAGIWNYVDEVMGRPEGWSLFHDGTGDASSDWFATPGGFTQGPNGITTSTASLYGQGCVGSGGFTPTIPDVDLIPADGSTRFQLSLLFAAGRSAGFVFLGLQPASIPFGQHCTLWVVPYSIIGPVPFNGHIGAGEGTLQLDGYNPFPSSGIEIFITYFCIDSSLGSATTSNAIKLTL